METRELICIGCPMGCGLSVSLEEGKVTKVTGNTCRRGEEYARKEVADPTRIVTSTVMVKGKGMVSVKTAQDIPKGKIMDCMRALKTVCVEAPVHIGQIIVENVADTGVPVVATKEIEG